MVVIKNIYKYITRIIIVSGLKHIQIKIQGHPLQHSIKRMASMKPE